MVKFINLYLFYQIINNNKKLNNMKSNAEKSLQIITEGIFIYEYPKYKGHKTTSILQIDINKPCKVGGRNLDGYCMNFYPSGKESGTVITLIDALTAASGREVTNNTAKIYFRK